MKMISALCSRHPEKNYGRPTWGELAGTVLATDYKSPPLCLIVYDTERNGTDSTDA